MIADINRWVLLAALAAAQAAMVALQAHAQSLTGYRRVCPTR